MTSEPTVLWLPGGVRTEVHLRGADTAGAFCLLVDELPPGWALPAHLHRAQAETMHVLAGRMGVSVDGGEERVTGPGETVHVPKGVLHSGRNAGAEPLRRVVLFSPAGMEDFFLEAGAERPEDVDSGAVLASALRHGWRFPQPG